LISIAERLKPFSHQPGVRCIVPGTPYRCEVFPTKLKIYDLSGAETAAIAESNFDFQGPIKQFTVQQNLEKGAVVVWGQAKQGLFRYHLRTTGDEKLFSLVVEKDPTGCLSALSQTFASQVQVSSFRVPKTVENLSLGISRAQEWPMVHRRLQLAEILPVWFRLGQLVPYQQKHYFGSAALLKQIDLLIANRKIEPLLDAFEALYCVGFEGILSPRLEDSEYQGLLSPSSLQHKRGSSLVLLHQGAQAIRNMLIDIQESSISILPCLPPEFHCGRMLHVAVGDWGLLDMEWSKKTIRRIFFKPIVDCSLSFHFRSGVDSFRLQDLSQKRKWRPLCGTELPFSAGHTYFFDNFQSS